MAGPRYGSSAAGAVVPRVQASRLKDFIGTLGVTVATAAFGTPDCDIPTFVKNIQYIGASAIRSGMPNSGTQPYAFPIFKYAATAGIKFCIDPGAGNSPTLVVADVITGLKTIASWATGCLLYIEQPNEPNFDTPIYQGVQCNSAVSPGYLPAAQFAAAFYTAVKSEPLLCNIPVITSTQTGESPDDVGFQFMAIPQGYSNKTLNTTAAFTAGGTTFTFADTTGLQVGMFMYSPLFAFNGGGLYIASMTSTTVTTGGGNCYSNVPSGSHIRFGAKMPDGTIYADMLNLHTYPMGGGPSYSAAQLVDPSFDFLEINLNNQFVSTNQKGYKGYTIAQARALPKVTTEYGYQTGPVQANGSALTQVIAGRNLMTAWLNMFARGYSFFFVYALFDESATNGLWGIYNFDETPKLAATYLHNFTTILADTAPRASTFPASALGVVLSGLPSTGLWQLFQRSTDHAFFLIMWNNVTNWNVATGAAVTVANTPVTVSFERSGAISVFDPTSGTTATSSSTGSTITVNLSDYPMIVSFL